MICKKILSLFIFSVLFLTIFTNTNKVKNVSASQISAPTITEIGSKRTIEGIGHPYISGLTLANTEVLIYIDGIYVNFAKINSKNADTDNFYFEHSKSLSKGKHTIYAIARDKTSLLMSPPTKIEFITPSLPAPTLIAPNKNTITGKVKPIITGLTVSNSFLHIYIDGIYNGKTSIVKHDSGTANFSYKPFLNLNVGWHKIQAIAEDAQGEKSNLSSIINFKIENPMPAPILFAPKTDNSDIGKPFIQGLAKNNSTIKIFIDNELNGQFKVKNNKSGTTNFSYKPFLALTRGNHLVYATAIDNQGKESRWSNIVYFNVKNPVISKSAQEKKQETTAKIEEPVSDIEKPITEILAEKNLTDIIHEKSSKDKEITDEKIIIDEEKIITDTEKKQEKSISDDDIKNLINEKIEKEKEESGLIDEDKTGQSKLRLNLAIFIAFLLGIIIWVFWVNKELIKERRAKYEDLDKNKDKSKDSSSENRNNENK